jgi:hypothetical protein
MNHLRLLTAVAVLSLSLVFTWFGRGERSAYALTAAGVPGGGLYGYNFTLDGAPLMAENTHYLDQTLMFSGAGSRFSMYFTSIRPLYAFLASTGAAVIGVVPALQLVNYLSWLLAAAVTWRFTRLRHQGVPAAVVATLLVGAGLGFVIHVHDYSPHILPFALSYLGILMVYESRVWDSPRPWSAHLVIGSYLALVSLTYSAGLVLAVAYVLVAVRHNRLVHVGSAAALALSAQYAWAVVLNLVNARLLGRWAWVNVQGIEQQYLADSLRDWLALALQPSALAARLAGGLAEFMSFECPVLVVLGVWWWFRQPASPGQRWFDVVFGGLPVAVGLLYLNASTTRGYLVYGMSLLLYATLAAGAVAWFGRAGRRGGMAVVAALLATQLAWSGAHLWGYMLPAKMFFGFGYLAWIPGVAAQWRPVPARSFTSAEPTPVMFGGAATLAEAGAYSAIASPPPKYSLAFAAAMRAALVAYLAALALAIGGRRRAIPIASTAVLLWIVPPALAQASPPPAPPVVSTFESIGVDPGQTLRASVALDEAFLADLAAQPSGARVRFFVWTLQPTSATRVTNGAGVMLAHGADGRSFLDAALDVTAVRAALAHSRRLELEIEVAPDRPAVTVFGWQRAGQPGARRCSSPPAGGAGRCYPRWRCG